MRRRGDLRLSPCSNEKLSVLVTCLLTRFLKKGKALKWGAKAVSKLLEQLLSEVMNKLFSFRAFIAGGKAYFLYFSVFILA